jgi:uncharacterized protein YjbJ (UPF0337 family)
MTHHEHGETDKDRASFDTRMDEFRGRVKKAAGELFDDEELRREGTVDQLGASVKGAIDSIVDRAKSAVSRDDDR